MPVRTSKGVIFGIDGVANAETVAHTYADRKQKLIDEPIARRTFAVFPDSVRLLEGLKTHGIRVAASSSKNANPVLRLILFCIRYVIRCPRHEPLRSGFRPWQAGA